MTALRHSFTHFKSFPQAFWIIIVVTLINQLGNMASVFLVAYLTIRFHYPLPLASLVYASLCGAMLVSGIFAGAIADLFGPPRVIAVILCTNSVVLICLPLLHEFLGILLICIIWGIVVGMYRPAAQTFLTQIMSSASYRVGFSIYRLAWNLGLSIGPAVGGYLATRSFQLIFFFNGFVNIIAGVVLILGLWFKPGIDHHPPSKYSRTPSLGLKFLKQDLALRFFVLGIVPICMVFYQTSSTLAVFINQTLHLSLTIYGLLFTINTLMVVFFELPINIATLSWSPRRSLILGSALIGLGFGGYLFASTSWHLFVLTVIWSVGEIILFPAASSYIAELAPEQHCGNYISIYNTGINLGLTIGPFIGSLIMQGLTARGLWATCFVWAALAIFFFRYIKPINYGK